MSTTAMTNQPDAPGPSGDVGAAGAGPDGIGSRAMVPSDSVLGRLQRGRGVVARRPRSHYADAVYDCVITDRRQNPCLDQHGLYYARLIVDLDLPLTPVVTWLNAFARQAGTTRQHGDTDPAHPTDLAIQVLGQLVRLGRDDACDPLIEHAEYGANWYAAMDEIGSWDEPVLDRIGQRDRFRRDDRLRRLPAVVLAGCDDEELRWLVEPTSRLWTRWARRNPRIAAAMAERRRVAAPPVTRTPGLADVPTADLVRRLHDHTDTEPGSGRFRIREVRELARRDPRLLLDAVEELLATGRRDRRTAVEVGIRELGPLVVPRARRWLREDLPYADVAIPVLAAHGTRADLPYLLADLEHTVIERDWFRAGDRVGALGRLRVTSSLPLLLTLWDDTEYAHLRLHVLRAVHRIRAEAARPLLAEAPWDCEHETRGYAAEHASLDDALVLPRLRRLRDEHAEDPAVRAAAARRLGPPNRLAR